ncbi:MAG: hypothetical protein WAX89_05885 [Alphaproteobacteria bacterium]
MLRTVVTVGTFLICILALTAVQMVLESYGLPNVTFFHIPAIYGFGPIPMTLWGVVVAYLSLWCTEKVADRL